LSDDKPTVERVSDLAVARVEWTRLAAAAGNIFSTWEWASAWHQHLGGGAELAIATARRPTGEATAILPLCVVRKSPFRLVRFVGAGPADQLGPVCAPAERDDAAIALRHHVEEVLGSSGLFLGERIWGEAPLGPQLGGSVVRHAASPALPILGASFDDFLASLSRNFRSQVRRRERNLYRAGTVAYRLTEDPDRLDADMRTLMRLHAARWSSGQSTSLSGPRAPFHLDFARRALENGWLRLWTLELDGTAVAAWYGLRFAGVEFYYQAGRDPAYDHLHVGFVLLCHSVRCAFEDGMREYRFGLGDEPYKSRFTEHDPGLDTIAIAVGARGRLALAAIHAALRMPDRVRRGAWRLGGRSPA
jgi:CelD/BcsL family acetyltransferase involved in cellulose biosynthesis